MRTTMGLNTKFRIHERKADGTFNYRFHKVRYTAALRLGLVLQPVGGVVEFTFSGDSDRDVVAHKDNESFKGTIEFEGQTFDDVVLIAQATKGRYQVVTFWPSSQHPDAHKSYVDPLVDTARDGTPYSIEAVASRMHAAFRDNPGVSPATLMKLSYEAESDSLRAAADRVSDLLEESHQRERELSEQLRAEQDSRRQAQAEAAKAIEDLKRLRHESERVPPAGTKIKTSDVVVLEGVSMGTAGRENQPAVLLHMSDGSTRANNWERGQKARFEYAKRLIGKRVTTDAWNDFNPTFWYQNVYVVGD
jgi:hypothetical protein